MSKKSRERRERKIEHVRDMRKKSLLSQSCFYDELFSIVPQEPDDVSTVVIKADTVYQHLRQNMPEFVIMKETDWAHHISVSVRPIYDNCFIEFDFHHSDGTVERSGIACNYMDDVSTLVMVGFIQFANAISPTPLLTIKLTENGIGEIRFPRGGHEGLPLTYSPYFTALYTLQMLNCRNIDVVDHEPNPILSKQFRDEFGGGLTTYKTLTVKSFGKRTEEHSESKDYQALMPLHLRRGNFATYTDDKPLFGKFTGTFWRPATAVGETKNGVVIKDYEVQP